ncbi:cucumisin-like [Dendrobium catenatum]|uniref:Cucumisin n=1 Tax=Dendrobium catenatum TaxID=906689 RepID=A0A2I0XH28_9ASPA|nr:cucumisin-like [Dendrobium catenatum]PKU87221.1 Cucumisin [Dendrobium catenatum]
MDRHLFPLLSSFLLLLLAMKALRVHAETTEPNQRPYIVYMGEKPKELVGLPPIAHSELLKKATGLSKEEATKRLIYSYTKSFNGFAAMLSDEEARKLSGLEELVSVFPSKQRQLHTTRSWNFMGFPSTVPHGPFESDVIVGMIDTGIWPESKSFNDIGFGPPPSKWKGICQSNHNFTCNNKIIGARYYHLQGNISEQDIPSPRDNLGHGTHTSSTAVGRFVKNASLAGIADGTARGSVPFARIAVYKVCWSDGCSDVDLLAAFEDAIADGVDIISLSIGAGGTINYFDDSIAIGSFHAIKKNILTLSSAGNSGPDISSIENYAPWLLTVAASTIDRKIVARAKLGNGEEFQGMAINTNGLDGEMYPLIFGGNAPNISGGANSSISSFCGEGTLDKKLVKGKVVLCRGLSDGSGLLLAGAVGAIMQTNGANDDSFWFSLPVSVLQSNSTEQVQHYTNKTSNPTASISKSQGVFDATAPYVVSFSSRGPNPITPNILKPDLTAPGVGILAAWSPLSNPKVPYNIMSGTSMSCPHTTGAAAYVKSFNPTWSSAAIKSALITTVYVMSSTKNAEAEFAYGAGHINPLAALSPGLIYDAQEVDYIKMLCGEGYSTKNLKLVTGDQSSCTSTNNGTVFDLNYPTFALRAQQGKTFSASFQRTVTNVGVSNSTYKAIVNSPSSLKINVEPNVLAFEALLEKKSFSIKIEGDAPKITISAVLIWSDGTYNVRSPIVVYTI